MTETRIYRGDKYTKAMGWSIPASAVVSVIRRFARRRVLVEYAGRRVLTFLWCLRRSA